MKMAKRVFRLFMIMCCVGLFCQSRALAANASFDVSKMGDMSDFDPANPIIPTGDTIKIAVVASYSGPAALLGKVYFAAVQFVAQDINKRGGITVDGKKKLIQVIQADHQGKVPICKQVCEQMVLQEHVNVLWGTNGSHLMKVINQVADKYHVIALCTAALSDELYDAQNFTRYSFMTTFTTDQIGRAFGYYYGQIRKKEKKFYILDQDYLFGHQAAEGFKHGLKEFYPEAQIVGEDYHKLFLTDFAPYLTKIKASGAEVIFTGDWVPDAANFLKQARQMGIDLPFANIFMNGPDFLSSVGIEATKGLVRVTNFGRTGTYFKTPEQIKYYKAWHDQFKKWKSPYNTPLWEHGGGDFGTYRASTYWLLSVMERAGSTDPEKIIKVFEGDSYDFLGKVYTMRACDHKVMQDLHIEILVPPAEQKQSYNIAPYYWFNTCSYTGPSIEIPAEKIPPLVDPKLCGKK